MTLLTGLLVAACTSCASSDDAVAEDPWVAGLYDVTADFSSFQTFDVVAPEDVPGDQTWPQSYLMANRVAVYQSIVAEMEALGLERDQADPDLRVVAFVRRQPIEIIQETWWVDYYYGWYWNYGYDWYDVDVVELETGTLIIDAVDVGDPAVEDDDVLVFRATATSLMPDEPTDVSERIPAIVAEMFDFWPSA